jgi:hypothetical protein
MVLFHFRIRCLISTNLWAMARRLEGNATSAVETHRNTHIATYYAKFAGMVPSKWMIGHTFRVVFVSLCPRPMTFPSRTITHLQRTFKLSRGVDSGCVADCCLELELAVDCSPVCNFHGCTRQGNESQPSYET